MTISIKSKPYIVPEYSLTGDLLSYKTCGLQYRYYNRGSLPPSKPVQLWFGEFIHGVMEEAYKTWRADPGAFRFPCSWETDVREIELSVNRRLKAKGLLPPPKLFCPYDADTDLQGYCPDANHPHKFLASKRAEAAINTWGQHLFPLITDAEVKLKGLREMSGYQENVHRSKHYSVTGIVDVISSISLERAKAGNLILHYINTHPEIRSMIDKPPTMDYEVIIDYKGMRRPPVCLASGKRNPIWDAHEWQIQTYAWLRSRQLGAQRPLVGIIFYLNELVPSAEDIMDLKSEINPQLTDIVPTRKADLLALNKWTRGSKQLCYSSTLREQRSIRMIPITDDRQKKSLQEFDTVVAEIENSIAQEMGCGTIRDCWRSNPDEKTCTACDFKFFCSAVEGMYRMSVP